MPVVGFLVSTYRDRATRGFLEINLEGHRRQHRRIGGTSLGPRSRRMRIGPFAAYGRNEPTPADRFGSANLGDDASFRPQTDGLGASLTLVNAVRREPPPYRL